MAVDKLVDSTQLDADLTSVANAIRTKGGTSAQLAFPADFVQAIEDIETGGGGGYVTAVFGEITPASDVTYINLPVTGMTMIIGTFGTTEKTEWNTYLGDGSYDNAVSMWIFSRAKASWWSCNASDINWQGIFYSPNTNNKSYKSNVFTVTNPTNVKVGMNGYKFKAGWTYHYVVFGVNES